MNLRDIARTAWTEKSKITEDTDECWQAALIGWSDDTRAEIETFVAIAIELMKGASVSSLRSATRTVELRYLMRSKDEET